MLKCMRVKNEIGWVEEGKMSKFQENGATQFYLSKCKKMSKFQENRATGDFHRFFAWNNFVDNFCLFTKIQNKSE